MHRPLQAHKHLRMEEGKGKQGAAGTEEGENSIWKQENEKI